MNGCDIKTCQLHNRGRDHQGNEWSRYAARNARPNLNYGYREQEDEDCSEIGGAKILGIRQAPPDKICGQGFDLQAEGFAHLAHGNR